MSQDEIIEYYMCHYACQFANEIQDRLKPEPIELVRTLKDSVKDDMTGFFDLDLQGRLLKVIKGLSYKESITSVLDKSDADDTKLLFTVVQRSMAQAADI